MYLRSIQKRIGYVQPSFLHPEEPTDELESVPQSKQQEGGCNVFPEQISPKRGLKAENDCPDCYLIAHIQPLFFVHNTIPSMASATQIAIAM